MIALYKVDKELEEFITHILKESGIQTLSFHSRKTVMDHVMNPFVLITPSIYVNEVRSFSIPIVPLSLHLSDFEQTIKVNSLTNKNPLIIVSDEEKKWLDAENANQKSILEIRSREQVNLANAKTNTSFLVPSWESHLPMSQQTKEHIYYVQPSKDTIFSAVRQAINLIGITREMFKEKYQVKAIVDSAHDGLIAVDRQGKITLTNENAKKYLGLEGEVVGKYITEFIPHSDMLRVLQTGRKEIGDVAKILDRQIIINRFPVMLNQTVVGAVSN
ncbi:PAS domain-containing protein, partial [Fictibacillus sp. NRS-1165]|uniref:PAS domain-containing protein n=1 Tax=Fictibacillus sp. NRS-1165 TaxID=3144463 RepID=UPI003D23ADE5